MTSLSDSLIETIVRADQHFSYMNGDAAVQQQVYRVFSAVLAFLFDPKVNPYGITIACDYENASEQCTAQINLETLGVTAKTSDSTSTITLCRPFFTDLKVARSAIVQRL